MKSPQLFNLTLPEKTRLVFFKNFIILEGPLGKIAHSGTNFIKKNDYFLVLTPTSITMYNKQNNIVSRDWFKFYNLLRTMILGVQFLYSKKLSFVGIGFRVWIKRTTVSTILVLKVRFSKDLFISVPKNVFVFSLKPTLLLVRGLSKETVSQFCRHVRSFKKPDQYKGKGIQYKNEIISLKPGKQN